MECVVLQSLVVGLSTTLQEIVSFVDPPNFDAALNLMQRKQTTLKSILFPFIPEGIQSNLVAHWIATINTSLTSTATAMIAEVNSSD